LSLAFAIQYIAVFK